MMVSRGSWIMALILATTLPAAIGFGGVYVMARGPDNSVDQRASTADAAGVLLAQVTSPASTVNALSQGDMVKFVFKRTPEAAPDVVFTDGAGVAKSLKDFKGRVVLLNLWATWCLPCRKEMPALDRLQASLGSDKFEVLALSVDRAGLEASRKFLDGAKVTNLKLYVDATAKMASVLKAFGMPTTILIDADGREIGRLTGEAEWDSEDAKKLVKSLLQ